MSRRTPPILESRAEPLGTAFDLLAAYRPPGVFFERRGIGAAGWIGAARLTFGSEDLADLSDVVELLRTAVTGRDASPVAAGAIAFGGDRGPHELVVPRRSVRRDLDGRTWRVDTNLAGGPDEAPPPFDRVAGGAPHEPFRDVQITEIPTSDGYERAVASAVDAVRETELRKVVLARTVEVDAGRTLDPRALVHRLRAVDPDAYTFAAPTDDGVIVGASPELLVSRHGREVRSNPLAGSASRSGDRDEDRASAEALAASSKDREEHVIVVEAVAEVLGPFCEDLRWDLEPVLRGTPNVWHLSTSFEGVLRDPPPSSLDLVAALHPTPAVAGTPIEAALATIDQLEPFSRGRYAGPVGWVDANGDGDWAIALRCAELVGDRATLYAGAGIVAGSDPEAELAETERKFQAFLDALRWG
ncbi:MAG TPA: isochorismate synthase [Actinomycetota bacterium]|nr:isochorismate synthase [Actinomycetota bacterium]